MKIVYLVLFFVVNLYSSELLIDKSNKNFMTFELEYYEDKKNALTLKDIIKINDFKKIQNNISHGYSNSTFWYHFSLNNQAKQNIKRILYITEINIENIDIFIVKNNKILQKHPLGVGRLNSEGFVERIRPEIPVKLSSYESKDIYIKVKTVFPHSYPIQILTEDALVQHKINHNNFLYLYIGALVSLILYNLVIYFYLKDNIYLVYTMFVFFYVLGHAHIFGLYPMDTASSVNMGYMIGASHLFWFAFHTIFSRMLLNTKCYYPKIDQIIKYISYIILVLGFIALFNLPFSLSIMNTLIIIIPLLLFIIAILVYKKGNKVAIFYIIAQFFFISSNMIFGLLFEGFLEYSYFTRYIHLLGSFIEAVLFALALGYSTYKLREKNQQQKELVDEYSKLSFLGQTVINIYHQWKSPVNNIYNSINHIEVAKEFKDKNLNTIIDENLEKIKLNTEYLKDTSITYLDYYKGMDQPKTKFNLKDEIENIVNLHRHEFEKIGTKVNIECDNIELFTKKNILTNILIILVENAVNVSKQRNIQDPKINIIATKNNSKVTIKVIDNLGGIKEKNINDIFEKNHSISSSTGLGLYLAKDFLIAKIGGEISVENIKDGSCFRIEIKL